jgi:hypothetical protein
MSINSTHGESTPKKEKRLDPMGHTLDSIEQKYITALDKLRFKCGRLDMNTWLTEEVEVGRVRSDVVRYVYFEDSKEVIVLGQRADEIAYAASKYHDLRAQNAALLDALQRILADVPRDGNDGCAFCGALYMSGDQSTIIYRSYGDRSPYTHDSGCPIGNARALLAHAGEAKQP